MEETENWINEQINIDEKFNIKIEEGKKYTESDFVALKKKQDEKLKKISEKKEDKISHERELKHQQKVQYKLCKFDTDIKYDNNYFPFKSNYYLNGKEIKHKKSNRNNTYIIDIISKKLNFKRINNFINVYDLIFVIKSIDKNNIITLKKNDISEILKHYSEKEMFKSLLNENFSFKNEEDVDIDVTPINLYLKIKFN